MASIRLNLCLNAGETLEANVKAMSLFF